MDERRQAGSTGETSKRRHLVQLQFQVDAASEKEARGLIEVCTKLGVTAVNTVKPSSAQIAGYSLDHSFFLPDGFDALADAGILDELVAVLPPPPDPEALPSADGAGGEEFVRAFESWLEATAERVEEIKAMPQWQEDLSALDCFRETVEFVVESSRLPRQPRTEDYPDATASAHGGRGEEYRRDYAAWHQEMRSVVNSRDRLIAEALVALGADITPELDARRGAQLREIAEDVAVTVGTKTAAWEVLEDVVEIVAGARDHADPRQLIGQITDTLTPGVGSDTSRDGAAGMLQQREACLSTDQDRGRPARGRGPGGIAR